MAERNRAAGKITDNLRSDGYPVTFGEHIKRFNAVVKCGLSGTLPCRDRRMSLMGFTFIFYNSPGGKAVFNAGDIAAIAYRKIGRNSVR